MKLRSKLLLSATCLLTISVAATATSAYAWFVSNRQATVAINNATVKTNATNLKITGSSTQGGTVTPGKDDESTTIESKVTATDISGNGIRFFKPRLSPKFDGTTNFMASSIEEVNSTQNYYHEFTLTFSQTNTNVTTGVYLGKGSTVTANTDIKKAVRVAFSIDGFQNVKLYLAPNGASQDFYLTNKSDTEINLAADDQGDVVTAYTTISNSESVNYAGVMPTDDVNDSTSKEDKSGSNYYLGNVTASSLVVTVRIWFEGMDSNCLEKNIADVTANLKFYGVNMDI